jgi:hypothetical protein
MVLEEYKDFLIAGARGYGSHTENETRYHSFKMALEILSKIPKPEVLELGTCHSFVSGGLPGCDSPDPIYWKPNDPSVWDWGAGAFTLVFGQNNLNLTTVDISREAINVNRVMTESLGINCQSCLADSVHFLGNIYKRYDLIYLDTGYLNQDSIERQLKEATLIVERQLLNPGGMILLDDVKSFSTDLPVGNKLGRSDLSLPYLLTHGFELIFEGFQYLLKIA